MVPEGESVMADRHSSRWLELEAERSNLQPQTRSRDRKQLQDKTFQDHLLGHTSSSQVEFRHLPKQLCQLGNHVVKHVEDMSHPNHYKCQNQDASDIIMMAGLLKTENLAGVHLYPNALLPVSDNWEQPEPELQSKRT